VSRKSNNLPSLDAFSYLQQRNGKNRITAEAAYLLFLILPSAQAMKVVDNLYRPKSKKEM
jgi:hypothetical protein